VVDKLADEPKHGRTFRLQQALLQRGHGCSLREGTSAFHPIHDIRGLGLLSAIADVG
jgi:hypothetical protein